MASKAGSSRFIHRRDVWIQNVLGSEELGAGHKVVLSRFAFHADNETGVAYVSNATLGIECGGMSSQTVSRAMRRGVDLGFIVEVSRGGTATGERRTSVRRCVFSAAGQTIVKPDGGALDPSQDRHGPPSNLTGTLVKSDGGPPSKNTQTPVRNDYPTKPVTKPITNPSNSTSELSAGAVGGAVGPVVAVEPEDVLRDEYWDSLSLAEPPYDQ